MNKANDTVKVQDKRTMKSSASRKTRNNKVYTAKGPRDRRIRLSANTAIQFYDVQDRLGYERASEAIDWLINKAKDSIDKLFGNSFQQDFEQYAHLDCQFGAHYLAENSLQNDYEVNTCQNFMGNSIGCNPCIQFTNASERLPYTSNLSSPYQEHGYHMLNSLQHIDEKDDEISRANVFNPKINLKHDEHQFMSNSMRLFLQPPIINHDDEWSSGYHKLPRDPALNLCLPRNCTSNFTTGN